ncbi:MAG: tRNA (adenosine(37)-N6)-dimethylallyltransferase [Evtepia sp.]
MDRRGFGGKNKVESRRKAWQPGDGPRVQNSIVICGPTATGKTKLGVALAKALDGEVVSADSMQVYRGMPIGTAQPTAEERDGVPHHMMAMADPSENYSVARYVEEATACGGGYLCTGGNSRSLVGERGCTSTRFARGRRFLTSQPDSGLRAKLQAQAAPGGFPSSAADLGTH